MPDIRFVHAADLHLGAPFKTIGAAAMDILKDANLRAYRNLIDLSIEREVDFLLIAGDVYDGADPDVRTQIQFVRGLEDLASNGIASYVVYGNHDPLDGRRSPASLPETAHIFDATPEWKLFQRSGEDEPVAAIQGVSYRQRSESRNLAANFLPPSDIDSTAEANAGRIFKIGLLHCNVGDIPGHGNYAPCSLEDLHGSGMDYWALGHVHTRQTLLDVPRVEYPGNLQSLRVNEPGARGSLIVEADLASRDVTTEFVPLDVVRWRTVDVDISEVEEIQRLAEKLEAEAREAALHSDGRDLMLRMNMVGRRAMSKETYSDLSLLDEMRESLAMTSSPRLFVERLRDETRSRVDIDERAEQDDLVGMALRLGAELSSTPQGVTELRGALADVFDSENGRAKPSFRHADLEEIDDAQLRLLCERARWQVLERLQAG